MKYGHGALYSITLIVTGRVAGRLSRQYRGECHHDRGDGRQHIRCGKSFVTYVVITWFNVFPFAHAISLYIPCTSKLKRYALVTDRCFVL